MPRAVMIDLDLRQTAPPRRSPPIRSRMSSCRDFVPAGHAWTQVLADMPPLNKRGSFPPDAVRLGPAARGADGGDGRTCRCVPRSRERFALDLNDAPTMVTLRGWTSERDGRIHCDSLAKRVTVLLYLNRPGDAWSRQEGCLRLLRGPDDLEDYAVEVPPVEWHTPGLPQRTDHLARSPPVRRPQRYSVQLNYMTTDQKARSEMRRHRISAFVKRLTRAA